MCSRAMADSDRERAANAMTGVPRNGDASGRKQHDSEAQEHSCTQASVYRPFFPLFLLRFFRGTLIVISSIADITV